MHVWSGAEVQALTRLALVRLELTPPPNFFTVAIQQPGNSYPSSRLSLFLVGVFWMYKASFTLSWTGLLALSSNTSAFPIHLMLLIPLMLCNGRFPCVPLVACIPVFFNSHLQAPLSFPDIHLTTLAGDLVDHICQFLLGEGVLHLGE